MRSYTAPGAPGRCQRCLLLLGHCLCAVIGPGAPSAPQVVIVRHHWEAWKSTGTARLAALALSNLRMLDMAAENPEPVRAALRELPDAWFLYPGGESSGTPSPAPRTLVVLDGTWRQTRKMLRRLPELSLLRRFSLPPALENAARQRLRAARAPGLAPPSSRSPTRSPCSRAPRRVRGFWTFTHNSCAKHC